MLRRAGILIGLVPLFAFACNGPPAAAAGTASWQKYETVNVDIVSGFTIGQVSDITTAFSNWNTGSRSSLTFNITTVSSAHRRHPVCSARGCKTNCVNAVLRENKENRNGNRPKADRPIAG